MPVDGPRVTHIGGPTTLIELDGLRVLTDPTFDAPGRRYAFGRGSRSWKTAGPAVAGDVVGFALRRPGVDRVALWISGDTAPHGGVRRFAERAEVDVAVLHPGAVRFGITGPVDCTMTAQQAVEL